MANAKKDEVMDLPAKTNGELPANLAETVKLLKSLKVGMELTNDFYEWEEGEEVRVIVIGTQLITAKDVNDPESLTNGGMISAIRVITEDGKQVLFADKVLRSTLIEVARTEKPTPYMIQQTETVKSAKGSYKKFRVFKLN